jgi:nucleoside-diphosphate-sugar epimerase
MIFMTGATGFVGRGLLKYLQETGLPFLAATRQGVPLPEGIKSVAVGNLDANTEWRPHLAKITSVIHLAGLAHVRNSLISSQRQAFRHTNVLATERLALQAAAAGVKRFVFLSSVKVNGEFTEPGHPFTADDQPAPVDAYGVSKHEAEQSLRRIAAETGMEIVIIRPPLVYGPGVKANFKAMMGWLVKGLPLPLASVTHNRRSFVALDNLIDLVVTCLIHPAAANQTFLVSDGEDLSTSELLVRTGEALGHRARLFPVPLPLLRLGAGALSSQDTYQRLCGSLQLDIKKTIQLLSWTPPLSVDEGLQRAAAGFLG